MFKQCVSHLLNGADRDSGGAGDDQVTVLDIWTDFIQNERDDVRLDGQEQNVALVRRFFVARSEIDAHFLRKHQEHVIL